SENREKNEEKNASSNEIKNDNNRGRGRIRILQPCHKIADTTNMIWVCDGAANVGQIGHSVGMMLTNTEKGRVCCITAIAAGSKPHIDIAMRAKKNIAINGCGNRCASKVLEKAGVKIGYEIDISKYLQKIPTLDFYEADLKRIATEVVKNANL
ncbi:MAG: putative zinc-binding protein, partial [Candidatus Methanomethylicaceae archaeon]